MNAGPQIRVHLNPENGTLCGKRVFADVTKVPRGAPPRLPGWVDLNPEMWTHLSCGAQRREHSGRGAPTGPACLRAQEKGPRRPRRGWPCTEQISSRQCAAPGTSTTCAEGSLRQGSPSKRRRTRRNTHIQGRTGSPSGRGWSDGPVWPSSPFSTDTDRLADTCRSATREQQKEKRLHEDTWGIVTSTATF